MVFCPSPSQPIVNARATRQRLRIQAEAVGKRAGLSTYAVRRIERGAETQPMRVARYIAAVAELAAAVSESLARLDAIAAAGVRPMTPAELAEAIGTGGAP
jgi:transcriptional regulator with XRE-family HTH domain